MKNVQPISLGKVFPIGFILTAIGGAGLAYLFLNTQPFIGPRWLLFFFTTLIACGLSMPVFTILQNRFSKKNFTEGILVRESILFAIYVDLLLWLQLGRVLNDLIMILLGVGFALLEIFLRISEKAVFNPKEQSHE